MFQAETKSFDLVFIAPIEGVHHAIGIEYGAALHHAC